MAWGLRDLPRLSGKRAIITGTGGIGYEAAIALASAGAKVVVAGRSENKGRVAVRNIQKVSGNTDVGFELLDLASLSSIAGFAGRIAESVDGVDILINNAGIMALPERQTTLDGFEMQFGVNHLGHFALTRRLLPLLLKTAEPRVVAVSSTAARMGVINFADLQSTRDYKPWRAYSQSKLANLMFALELQRRSNAGDWGLTSACAHPGFARTSLIRNGPGESALLGVASIPLSQSAAAGALPIVFAAAAPEAAGGGFFGPVGIMEMKGPPGFAKIPAPALDPAAGARLWLESEKLTNVEFPAASPTQPARQA